jgi:hypothetical protein
VIVFPPQGIKARYASLNDEIFSFPDSATPRNPHSLMGLLLKLEIRDKSRDRQQLGFKKAIA